MSNASAAGPSNRLVNLIATFEGFRGTAYKCSAGKDTIGYGHLITEGEEHLLGTELTKDEALALLRKDIIDRTSMASVGVDLEDHQRDALVSLCFNIGTTKFAAASVVKHVSSRDFEGAREYFGHWRRAAGEVVPGLCMRRLAEVCIFSHCPAYPDSSEPPSVQWGASDMPITDDNWGRMSVEMGRRASEVYDEYWKSE